MKKNILSKKNTKFVKDYIYKKGSYEDYGSINFLDLKNPFDKKPSCWILFIPGHVNTGHVKVNINDKYLGYLKDKEGNLIEKGRLNPDYYYMIIYKNDKDFYLLNTKKKVNHIHDHTYSNGGIQFPFFY